MEEPPLIGALRNLAHAVALLPDNLRDAWAAFLLAEARACLSYSPDHPSAAAALALGDAQQALADVLITIGEIPHDEKEPTNG